MVEQIKGLSIQGRCFSDQTNLDLFPAKKDRVSMIFGRNGSGKSTISKGIDGVVHADGSDELLVSFYDYSGNPVVMDQDSGRLFVFNEDYVQRYMRVDEDGLQTILLLGDQIDIKEEMDRCMAREGHAEEELSKVDIALFELSGEASPEHSYGAVANILKAGGWADRDRDVKGNKNKTAIRDSVVAKICEKTEVPAGETMETLKAKFDEKLALLKKVSSHTASYPEPVGMVQWNSGMEDRICGGLSKAIEKPVWTERERQIFAVVEKYKLPFVRMAQTTFGREKTTVCPYCYQDVAAEYKLGLLESINRVLNPDAETHGRELRDWDQTLENLSRDLRLESARQCHELDPALWETIDSLARMCLEEMIPRYRAAISDKAGNVYRPAAMEPLGLEKALLNLNSSLRELEGKRLAFNEAVKSAGRLQLELTGLNNQIAHLQTSSAYAAYKRQLERKRTLERARESWYRELEESRRELERLARRRSDASRACTMMNREMDCISSGETHLHVELSIDSVNKTERYVLKSNQGDIKPDSVSTGERNIIALCYFFAEIFSNQDEDTFYQKEALIVLDDPFTGLDFENCIGVLSLLRIQIRQFLRGNPDSRILMMSHNLDAVRRFSEMMEKKTGLSAGTGESGSENDMPGSPYYVCELSGTNRQLGKFYHFKETAP